MLGLQVVGLALKGVRETEIEGGREAGRARQAEGQIHRGKKEFKRDRDIDI